MANKFNEEINSHIGERLKNAREEKKVTRKAISDKTGFGCNQILKVEKGASKGSIELLLGYCDVLGVQPNDILVGLLPDDIPECEDEILVELKKLIKELSKSEQEKLIKILKIMKEDKNSVKKKSGV